MMVLKNDLLRAVESVLLPRVRHLGLGVAEHQEGSSFDNATVTLASGDVRVRVVRERSIVHMEVASVHSPHAWVDSAVLMEHLGLSKVAGFHGLAVEGVLEGIGSFLKSSWADLERLFDKGSFRETNRALDVLREERSARRWGS
jgi:hypothetical protein